MAGAKKKSKGQTRAKSAPKKAASKKVRTKATKPPRKTSSAKKKVMARKPPRPTSPAIPPKSPKAFAEKVRDCDAGTETWFIVAGSVEHASIRGRGSDGTMVIRTDAGVTEVVPVGNLFETAEEARAARHR